MTKFIGTTYFVTPLKTPVPSVAVSKMGRKVWTVVYVVFPPSTLHHVLLLPVRVMVRGPTVIRSFWKVYEPSVTTRLVVPVAAKSRSISLTGTGCSAGVTSFPIAISRAELASWVEIRSELAVPAAL
ncbi:hypothetical protein D3C72_1814780 [compost metagenome]